MVPSDASSCLISSAQAVAQARIECCKGLVEQDQARLGSKRTGHGDALLLAARELVGAAMAEAPEPDQLEQVGHALPAAAAARQPEADVLGDAEMGEEQAFLRHVADAPAVRRDVVLRVVERVAVERDPPAIRLVEACDQAQERRLARSRRAEHGGEAARRHCQGDVGQYGRRPVGLGDALDRERAHVLVAASASNQRTRK